MLCKVVGVVPVINTEESQSRPAHSMLSNHRRGPSRNVAISLPHLPLPSTHSYLHFHRTQRPPRYLILAATFLSPLSLAPIPASHRYLLLKSSPQSPHFECFLPFRTGVGRFHPTRGPNEFSENSCTMRGIPLPHSLYAPSICPRLPFSAGPPRPL